MPRFEIGEVVILQSVSMPNLNGEYTVEQIVRKGDPITCRKTGVVRYASFDDCPPGYVLDGCIAEDDYGIETAWNESALRKKQQKGGMSYKELMNTLKNPVMEWN